MIAAQGVTDQHGIAARLVELTIGFINQLVVCQIPAAGQGQGCIEVRYAGFDGIAISRAKSSRARSPPDRHHTRARACASENRKSLR